MNHDTRWLCTKCGVNPMEDFGDGEPGPWCERCNDRAINQSNNSREWAHFHPSEPCPPDELDKVR
jgi:hypothetical protein